MTDKWLGTPPFVLIPRLKSLLADVEQLAEPGSYAAPDEVVLIRNSLLAQLRIPRQSAPAFRNDAAPQFRELTAPLFRDDAAP